MCWDPNANWDAYSTNFQGVQSSYDATNANNWDPNMSWDSYSTNVEDGHPSHDATNANNWDFDFTNDAQNQFQNRNNNDPETSNTNRLLFASVGAISSIYYHTYMVKEPCST